MVLGKKQMEQLAGFTSSALAYGLAAGIVTIYLTDWKAIVAYIPYYNGQFKGKKEPEPGCE